MRASSPMAERGATEVEQLVAVENLGCRGRLFVIVVFDRMVLEGKAFVEFDERNREVDFGGGGARAQHLEDHDGIADDLEGRIKTGADHHSVRIATAVFRGLDLEVAAEELAWLSAQPASERQRKIALNGGVGEASASHCDGLGAVEFVAQFLPLLPCEEFGERHRLCRREVHGRQSSTVAHGGLPWLWLTVSAPQARSRKRGVDEAGFLRLG